MKPALKSITASLSLCGWGDEGNLQTELSKSSIDPLHELDDAYVDAERLEAYRVPVHYDRDDLLEFLMSLILWKVL